MLREGLVKMMIIDVAMKMEMEMEIPEKRRGLMSVSRRIAWHGIDCPPGESQTLTSPRLTEPTKCNGNYLDTFSRLRSWQKLATYQSNPIQSNPVPITLA